MHLDIGLPLLSELEQLCKAFWQNNSFQNHPLDQENSLSSNEQTQSLLRQSPSPKQCSDMDANNYAEPYHITPNQQQNITADIHSNGQQHAHNVFEGETEPQDTSRPCSRSTSTDLCKKDSESWEHNGITKQPNTQEEPSQPLKVKNPLGLSSRPRRSGSVQWDSSTEDSSFL